MSLGESGGRLVGSGSVVSDYSSHVGESSKESYRMRREHTFLRYFRNPSQFQPGFPRPSMAVNWLKR